MGGKYCEGRSQGIGGKDISSECGIAIMVVMVELSLDFRKSVQRRSFAILHAMRERRQLFLWSKRYPFRLSAS